MCIREKSISRAKRLVVVAVAALLFTVPPSIDAADGDRLEEQLQFGIKMARRGLWNEALFRFSKVLEKRPGDVRVLNNVAVAYEAIGEFDLALEYYKRGLEGDSGNRELRRNYAQFVEFYDSLKPEAPATGEAEAPAAVNEAEEALEDRSVEDGR